MKRVSLAHSFLGLGLLLTPFPALAQTAPPTAPLQTPAANFQPLLAFEVGGPATARRVQGALASASPGVPTPLSVTVPRQVTGDALRLIAERRFDPPSAARALALTLSAVHDVQGLAQASGRTVDTDTAAQVAATRVLMVLFPADAAKLARDLTARLRPLPPATDRASWALGDAVAAGVLAFAAQDGAAQAQQGGVLATGEGLWEPLNGQHPLEPGWGRVSPIGLNRQNLPRVAPPPAWNSPEFAQDRADFAEQQTRLTAQDLALAHHWAAGVGTVTPLGMWMEEALRQGEQARLGGPELTRLLTLTAVAGHNAFISCWQAKFEYNVARPQSWLTRQQAGWSPALPTPPFPSYPSGHATVSGAAAEVLAQFFPLQARQLRQQADAAAFSRVVGGIHWSVDGSAGLDAGQRVAQALLNLPTAQP
ncbi:vanadium-dependent haloperoxidase [Deinococcus sp. VB343]|uniref:vanadium-dependent haloperoxidase n=1 Tax=Deinococcus sp. VB343 TaxID=3385567 RepID=UPI0039C9CF97